MNRYLISPKQHIPIDRLSYNKLTRSLLAICVFRHFAYITSIDALMIKLEHITQTYVGKLTEMIDGAKINTLTVLVMEVPCCRGLVQIARQAREKARRHIPVKTVVLSAGGEVIDDQWI